jgi:uncharacterized protein YbaP (TraB family)
MTDDCEHCKEHDTRVADSKARDRKLEQNCKAIESISERVIALEKLETHFEYMRKGMDQIQKNHKESLEQMEKANEKALQQVVAKVVQMEWIVRGVFLIILAAFVKFMAGGSIT